MVKEEEYEKYEQAVIAHYNKLDKIIGGKYKDFDWMLVNKVGGIKNKKVLNLGCAYPGDEMKSAHEAKSWIAVDFAPETINKGHSLQDANEIPQNVTFLLMDITDLKLEDNQFDIVLSFSTIDHLPNPAKRIKAHQEAFRVLKNNCFFVITFPNILYIKYQHQKEGLKKFGYEYRYHPDELRKELEDARFKFIDFGGCDGGLDSSRSGFIMKKEV